MKKLLLLLIVSSVLFAQYSADDTGLIKTTFLREFNRSILEDYITSGDDNKIDAALLSMAHSEDTTLVDLITTPDFSKHGKYIAFALGEIGACTASADYLWGKISAPENNYLKDCYEADIFPHR